MQQNWKVIRNGCFFNCILRLKTGIFTRSLLQQLDHWWVYVIVLRSLFFCAVLQYTSLLLCSFTCLRVCPNEKIQNIVRNTSSHAFSENLRISARDNKLPRVLVTVFLNEGVNINSTDFSRMLEMDFRHVLASLLPYKTAGLLVVFLMFELFCGFGEYLFSSKSMKCLSSGLILSFNRQC